METTENRRRKPVRKNRSADKNANVLNPQIPSIVQMPWHDDARLIVQLGRPPILTLVGEPGVGKTTFAHQLAMEMTGKPPLTLSGAPDWQDNHLFGRWTLVGGETRFEDGPLVVALKEQRFFIIEEFSQIPLEVRSHLLPLRDQAEITNPLTREVLSIPPGFRLIATSNSESLGCRKNSGIALILFDGVHVLKCGDLSTQQAAAVLATHFPQTNDAQRETVLNRWSEYREFTSRGSSGRSYLSIRAALQLMQLMQAGMPEHRAVEIALINKFLVSDPELYRAAQLKNDISS